MKMIMLEVWLELNIHRVVEEITDHGNIDTAAIPEPLDMQLEELSEGKLIIINEKRRNTS